MTVKEMAAAFAHEHGRRTRPFTDGKKFTKPDPDLYWGLEQGFLAGARWQREQATNGSEDTVPCSGCGRPMEDRGAEKQWCSRACHGLNSQGDK